MTQTVFIPEHLKVNELTRTLASENYQLVLRENSKDIYLLNKKRLLNVYTDRINLFGFILGSLIPRRGEVSAALAHFGATTVIPDFNHDLIRSCNNLRYNAVYDLQNDGFFDLPIERCLITKNEHKKYPFLMTYRYYLDESIFNDYEKNGKICGQQLPAKMTKWAKLDNPIFTPNKNGENIKIKNYFIAMNTSDFVGDHVKVSEHLRIAYSRAHNYVQRNGVIITKTDFRLSDSGISGDILTPDSSYFILESELEKAIQEDRNPNSFDKQFLIEWAENVATPFGVTGINNLDQKDPDHNHFVHNLTIPKNIIKKTTKRLLNLVEFLTGKELDIYQTESMGVCYFAKI